MARHRLHPVPRRREHRRQREQRHHDPGGDERLAVDAAALGVNDKGANSPAGRRQPEQRDHDVGRAGDDLDARLDDPRQPRRPAVLGYPHGAATASGTASAIPITVRSTVPRSGSRKPPEPAWVGLTWGRLKIRPGRRYWIAAEAHVEDDRAGDEAQADPRHPGARERQAVAPAPAARRGAPAAAARRRPRDAGRWVRSVLIRASGTCAAGA